MAFLTLFLGLITGVHPVELTIADPQVVRIELLLDGRTVGVLTDSPWRLTADLGDELTPHELAAVGYDSAGREVSEARQWINMPRDRAEVTLVTEGDREGRVERARLAWSSVDVARPETAKVFLDGAELEGIDPKGFSLPSYDVSIPHLLQAEVQLGNTTARAQAVVGGGSGSASSQGLTALPLYLDEGARLPSPAEMEGWLEARGEAVRVVAVERPGADVIMVQDLAWYLQKRLKGARNEWLKTRVTTRRRPTGLKSRDHFRLLFPIPEAAGDAAIRSLHYPMSPNLWAGQLIETHAQGAVDRQTADAIPQGLMVGIPVNGERKLDTSNQHLTDGVAVGALAAAQGQRARVLLLIAGSDERDHSRYSPEQVRSYLARLNVPLRIWSPEPEKLAGGWGEVESIATRNRLERAMRELRSFLDRQVVVWVEGLHLPHQLQLTAAAAGRLRRITDIGPPPPLPAEDADLDPGLMIAELPSEEPAEDPAPGQTPAPPETAVPSGQAEVPPEAASSAASFGETVEVNVVNVDVIVTSKDGTRVRDLTRQDFRLYEDGEPVEITYFEGPPAGAPEPAVGPAGGAASDVTVAARPMSLIVYLDLFRLTPKQRARTLKALEAGLAGERQRVRVMIMTDDGSVEIPLTFTEDRAAILATISEIASRKHRAFPDNTRDAFREMAEVRRAITYAHGLRDEQDKVAALRSAYARRRAVEGTLPLIAGERMREIRHLVASLERLGLALSGVDGRRAILYVGNRLSMSPGEDLFSEAAALMADPTPLAARINGFPEDTRQARLLGEVGRLRLTTAFDDMIRETSAVGVTFYTLTPPNLEDSNTTWREIPAAAARSASTRNEAIKAAACVMSGETGGLCQVGGSDMTQLLESTFDDFGAYYSLAFTPGREPVEKPSQKGKSDTFHRIKVEVDRPGLRLRYREGYLDRPREDAVRDRLIAALTFGEEQDELGMRLAMEPQQATEAEGMFLIPFEVRLPAQRLALLPLPEGDKRQANARLMITTMDRRGRTTGVQEYPIRFEVSEARLASGQPLLYAHKVRLTLAAGEQTLAVGIWDDAGRAGSFVSRRLEVGSLSKPGA